MNTQTKSQIVSFILPFMVLIVIPAAILNFTGCLRIGWGLGLPYDVITIIVGIAFAATGLYLLISTITLFIKIGRGTLAPWSPTQKLVVTGPYRYVRNPMITGVLIALLGETILTGSIGMMIWTAIFFIVNHFYFIFWEEPGLVKRFGEEYMRYQKNVPRWITRPTPWKNG